MHKDLDFAEMGRTIGVASASLAVQLRNQITQDAGFLASQGVIDYSLLLGVAKTGAATAAAAAAAAADDGAETAWVVENEPALRTSYDALGACSASALSFRQFAKFVFQHRELQADPADLVGGTAAPSTAHPMGSVFTRHQGGMIGCSHTAAGESEQEVLFVGVIDTLVPFKMKKKAEFMAKSLIQHGQNFSVIPPEEYAARFTAANTAIVSEHGATAPV